MLRIRLQLTAFSIFLSVTGGAYAREKASKNLLVYPATGEFDEGYYRKICESQYDEDSVSYCLQEYRGLAANVKTRIIAKQKEKEAIQNRILALGYDARELEFQFGEPGKPMFERFVRLMTEKGKRVPSLVELDTDTEILGQAEVGILRLRLLKRLVKRPVPKVKPEVMLALGGKVEDSISRRGKFTDTTDAEVYFAYNLFLNPGSKALDFPGYRKRILGDPALAYKLLLIETESGKDTVKGLEAALDSFARLEPADLDLVFGWKPIFAFTVERVGYLAADYFEGYWDYSERNPPADGKPPERIPSASFRRKCEPVLAAFKAYHKTESGGYRALMRVLSDPRGWAPKK